MDEADLLRSEATLCLVAVKNRSSPNIIKVSDVIAAKLLYNLLCQSVLIRKDGSVFVKISFIGHRVSTI